MHIRRALYAAVLAALLPMLAIACRGGDDGAAEEPTDLPDDFAARVLQLGEPVGTVLETRQGALVPGLQAILNPEPMTTIGIAVEAGDERLTLIAETVGITADEFRAAWEDDRASAFALFATGLRNADDAQAIRDELFLSTIAALPVHPDGVLVGTSRIDNPDGSQRYILVYDLAGDSTEIEQTVARQLDQSPWQATGGQSSEEISIVQFQSTISADVQGVAWVQPIASSATLEAVAAEAAASDDEASGDAAATIEGPFASLLYLIQALPPSMAEPSPFELPIGRPLPQGFPAAFLIDDDMTIVNSAWSTQPGGTVYRLTILTVGSNFDLADSYRERIEAEGWELTSDEAVGFATLLAFASEDDGLLGQVELDAFAEDDSYAQIVIDVQVSSRSPSPE